MGPKLLVISLNYRTAAMTLRSVRAALGLDSLSGDREARARRIFGLQRLEVCAWKYTGVRRDLDSGDSPALTHLGCNAACHEQVLHDLLVSLRLLYPLGQGVFIDETAPDACGEENLQEVFHTQGLSLV